MLVVGCQKKDEKTSNTNSGKQCYLMLQGKDSLQFSYSTLNNEVEGNLFISGSQKQNSEGKITGNVVGDTLKLIYDFKQGEEAGKREVILLKDNGNLIMAAGVMSEVNGITLFDDPKGLDFNKSLLFQSVDCK